MAKTIGKGHEKIYVLAGIKVKQAASRPSCHCKSNKQADRLKLGTYFS